MDKKYWKVGELTSEIVEQLLSDIPSDGSITESECEDMDEDIVLRGDEEVATNVHDIMELDNTVDEVAAAEDVLLKVRSFHGVIITLVPSQKNFLKL